MDTWDRFMMVLLTGIMVLFIVAHDHDVTHELKDINTQCLIDRIEGKSNDE